MHINSGAAMCIYLGEMSKEIGASAQGNRISSAQGNTNLSVQGNRRQKCVRIDILKAI